MKPSAIFAGTVAAILLTASACNRADEKASDNSVLAFSKYEKVGYYKLLGSAKAYETDSDAIFQGKTNLLLPSEIYGHDTAVLRDSIFKAAFDTTGTETDSIAEAAMRRAASEAGFELLPTECSDTISYDGIYIVDGELRDVSSRTLSYAVTESTYLPLSAHGMYSTVYINYDLREGRVFTLADILTADALGKLPVLLRQSAWRMRNFIGPTDLTALPSGGNFYIDLSGNIVFVYQPYEIASYAQGIIEIPVPAYQLSDDLTPYGTDVLLGGALQ